MAVPDNILVHSMEVLLEANSANSNTTIQSDSMQPDTKINHSQLTSNPQEGISDKTTLVINVPVPSVADCEESADIASIELTADQTNALISAETQQAIEDMRRADVVSTYPHPVEANLSYNVLPSVDDLGKNQVENAFSENEDVLDGKFKTVECQTMSWEELVAMIKSTKPSETGCDSGSLGDLQNDNDAACDIPVSVVRSPSKVGKRRRRYYCQNCSEHYNLCHHVCSFIKKSRHVPVPKTDKMKKKKNVPRTNKINKKKDKKGLNLHVGDQVDGDEYVEYPYDPLRPFKCTICGKGFTKASRLKIHQITHTGIKAFKCEHCDKRYTQKSSLNIHARLHSDEVWFTCEHGKCHKHFRTIERLKKHMTGHTDKKQFECPHCGADFKTIDSLKRHLVTHAEQQSRLCEHCGKNFRNKKTLGQHIKFMHADAETSDKGKGQESPGLNCDLCDKVFRSKYHLMSHRITHTNSRPFACDECDKTYRTRSALRCHKKAIHCGIKDNVCETCLASFSTPAQLRNHQTIHTGERPHKCPHCDIAFRHVNSLTLHIRKHTGERPHVCTICERSFRYPGNLKSHIMTHTKERPWQCDQCGKKFARQATLADHKKTHSGEKNCICPYCGKAYRLRGHLRYHMKSHTKKQEPDNSGAGITNPSVPVKMQISDQQFPLALQSLTEHPFQIYESY